MKFICYTEKEEENHLCWKHFSWIACFILYFDIASFVGFDSIYSTIEWFFLFLALSIFFDLGILHRTSPYTTPPHWRSRCDSFSGSWGFLTKTTNVEVWQWSASRKKLKNRFDFEKIVFKKAKKLWFKKRLQLDKSFRVVSFY